MSTMNSRSGQSRRTFILAGAAGALAVPWALSRANAQQAAGAINFRVSGTHGPTLVFVHGFACALEDWDVQVKALAPKFRCIALDLPGHGASAKPANGSMASMAAAVNQVKEKAKRGGKILIGHSMGCRVITEAYLQSHKDVVGLVFVDGSMLGGDPEAGVKHAKESVHAGIDSFTDRLFKDMFLEGSDPAVRERVIARAKKVDPVLRQELFVDMARWDLIKARNALKQIAISVLVIQSTYFNNGLKRVSLQPGMTTPWMDTVAATVPTSRTVVVPNAGHFVMIDAAATVSEEIGKFAAAEAQRRAQSGTQQHEIFCL